MILVHPTSRPLFRSTVRGWIRICVFESAWVAFFLMAVMSLLVSSSKLAADEKIGLPFSTDETTGSLTLQIRHRVEWHRKSGAVKWSKLEAEIPKVAKLKISPAGLDPDAKKDQQIEGQLTVRGGRIDAVYTQHGDGSWSTSMGVTLEPRDARWTDPKLSLEGISAEANLSVDSRLTSGPLPLLAGLEARKLNLNSLQAGPYHLADIRLTGSWSRPSWKVGQLLIGDFFGGRLEVSGTGELPADGPARTNVTLKGEGVDLQAILKSFSVPRADEIQGSLDGRMRIETNGDQWKIMAFDLAGREGTVFLSRPFVDDLFIASMGDEADDAFLKFVKETIEGEYGPAPMIPFERMEISGNLDPQTLMIQVPLRNRALEIMLEPRIDREFLWEAWGYLVGAGADNIRGVRIRN